MQLQEFFDYKNQLMEDLLTNEDIVRLIDDTVALQNADSLAYTQVFPCEYVPDTVQEGKTYICFDVDVQRAADKTFLSPTLFVWVFTHRSKLRLPEGGVRTDKLCSEICKAINGSRKYGLGELNLYSVKRFAPMTDFQGKVLTFYAKDFNRVYDGKKYTPENRKRG
ncbi:MAG: hypothetical protein O0V67_05915 [Methanocorpusculum sp.]|nr:hypothetical protein [Methanocorpusculum sp.]